MGCKQEWNGIGRTPGGAGQKDRSKLRGKLPPHAFTATRQHSQDSRGPTPKYLLVRNKDELSGAFRIVRSTQQIALGRERQSLQVIERADGIGLQALCFEESAIMRRKRNDDISQVALEFLCLQTPNFFSRQPMPLVG